VDRTGEERRGEDGIFLNSSYRCRGSDADNDEAAKYCYLLFLFMSKAYPVTL